MGLGETNNDLENHVNQLPFQEPHHLGLGLCNKYSPSNLQPLQWLTLPQII